MGAEQSRAAGAGAPPAPGAPFAVQPAHPGEVAQTAGTFLCVGIDLGTARSGYAFAYGALNQPQLQFSWPGEATQQAKTLTALLYDRAWQPIAWGMDAVSGQAAGPHLQPRWRNRSAAACTDLPLHRPACRRTDLPPPLPPSRCTRADAAPPTPRPQVPGRAAQLPARLHVLGVIQAAAV